MPKKKPADKPEAQQPVADAQPMDADVEAKRSGPPPDPNRGVMPQADVFPPDAAPQPVSDAEGEANSDRIAEIEAKLKDPSFDPSGEERLRLAEESRGLPGRQYPNTTDVDTHGDPATDEPKR